MSHTLLEQWQSLAYNEKADRGQLQRFWGSYFQIEKEIYEQLLENPDEEVKGTVKELAEKYGQEVLTMVGFLLSLIHISFLPPGWSGCIS